ncbi:glutathione S-transferase family protein [Sphingobium sp. 3R8]|uniref:glutathione S-transferase family protein n=1 Tax=Sphingobium sp. 3R8 TaxID=2874921 RepID=UPI001CC9CBE7|nr:glutathione S-transferase family protein [Sphingobium sp. 3R8]MBZ9650252.1 glutathione S-transferase family protein [Sphingobium sp. 3R8]
MKLYGMPPTRVLRPLWLLNELGLDYEMIPVDLGAGAHLTPEFLTINPVGKVPVLVDGDIQVSESAAISLYLAERYGGGRFIPTAIEDRAAMYQWIMFLVTEIEQPLWRIALHTGIYPESDRRPDELPLAERDCRRMLVPIESHLKGRKWFVGTSPSVADFIAAFTIDWADEAGFLDQSPNARRFVERMYARGAAPPTIKESWAALERGDQPPGRRAA